MSLLRKYLLDKAKKQNAGADNEIEIVEAESPGKKSIWNTNVIRNTFHIYIYIHIYI